MTLRVLIVEDEPLARSRLLHLLAPYEDVQVIGECDNVPDAAQLIESEHPDVLFLDVQMPQASGFDLLHAIPLEQRPVVIFTTAHPDFALKAFDLSAADYLVKPFDQERIGRALDRARRLIGSAIGLETPKPATQRRDRFAVRAKGEIIFVKTVNIDWIAAEGNYVRLHLGQVSYLVRQSMQHIEEMLDPALFARVHRSAIVNIDRVRKLVPDVDGSATVVLATGAAIPLGASYRSRLEDVLGEKL
jgi:two-component system, LytTR family, response regulator